MFATLLGGFLALAPGAASAEDGSPTPTASSDPSPVNTESPTDGAIEVGTQAPTAESSPTTQQEQAPSAPPRLRAATTSALITQPSEGSLWPSGSTITFTVSGLSYWYVDLGCGDEWYSPDTWNPDVTVENPSTSDAISCSGDLYDWDTGAHQDTVNFAIARAEPRPNEIRNLTVSHDTFYPRIRDGYRDSVTFALGNRQDAELWMYVRNSDGRTVRSKRVHRANGWSGYERDRVRWNGENNNGSRVPIGRYRVIFESRADGFQTARSAVAVKVATGYRTVRHTKSKDGWWGSSDRTRGSCYSSETFYPHGILLDCWGGAYAQATYTFGIPSNARIRGWFARGERNCCSNGRVIKTGKRTAPRRYRVTVRVTNWASFTVTRAGVTYRSRERI